MSHFDGSKNDQRIAIDVAYAAVASSYSRMREGVYNIWPTGKIDGGALTSVQQHLVDIHARAENELHRLRKQSVAA